MKAPAPTRALGDLLVVVGPLCLLAAVVLPVNQLTQSGGVVEVRVTGDSALTTAGLPTGAALQAPADAPLDLVAGDLPPWLRVMTEAGPSLTLLMAGAAALLLWRLLRNLSEGEIFQLVSARQLVALAVVLAAGSLLAAGADYLAATAVLAELDAGDEPVRASFVPPVLVLLLAALALVVAEAVRKGTNLRDELDGLV